MNQHNEQILLRYAQTEQTERAHAAEAWQASRTGPQQHILRTGLLSAVALMTAVLVVWLVLI